MKELYNGKTIREEIQHPLMFFKGPSDLHLKRANKVSMWMRKYT